MSKFKYIASFLAVSYFVFFCDITHCVVSDKDYAETCILSKAKNKYSQKRAAPYDDYKMYNSFTSIAKKTFIIPGLNEGFVPQGLTFCESLNSFMISGYSSLTGEAYIITINAANGKMNGEYKIIKKDGNVFCGHNGGIASYGKNIYITDGYMLCCISLHDFNTSSQSVNIKDEILLPSSASYISIYDGYLWAGNFYHKSFGNKYDFSAVDKYEKEYRTVIFAYRLDNSYNCGLRTYKDTYPKMAEPYLAIYAPNEVQGLAFSENGDIHLSCSYGRYVMSSQLLYKYPPKKECTATINLGNKNIPAWFLNNDSLINAVYAQPMSEGVVIRNGKTYIIFESAAKKYVSTALNPTDCVWELKWK